MEQGKQPYKISSEHHLDLYNVDTQETFQKFVEENIGPEFYNRIKNNRIYKQISQNLRETHNFAAIYKMAEILSRNEYDLVILDTPPCHQVIEFFESPQKLQSFFSANADSNKDKNGWVKWVQNKGVQAVEKVLKNIVGMEFVGEMEGFFSIVGQLKGKVQQVTATFLEVLKLPSTELILVFSAAKDKISEAQFLQGEMAKNDFTVDGFVLNRAFIPGLDLSKEAHIGTDTEEAKLYNYFQSQKAVNVQMLRDLQQKRSDANIHFSLLPELNVNFEDEQGIFEFAESVERSWEELK